ncbi:hypothetical protein D3P07_20830 [Paenibacillus sp. 1011MAR3C5]|uniref:hypothetical protein n=1 Tax=Paenibacillus sp. 1011MAR3C5 TaxID=1675787 RepID=UPI000E6B7A01|nr:hypothetical protein [Paenibacillus sp. 1011MAR3C5]RJE85641.1 hypothetical protein D3P07_20830 [Paenibacillus sp. 1011MAR3C5]
MSTVQKLHDQTLCLVNQIQLATIEQLTELLELRDEVIAVLSQSANVTQEDKHYIKQIASYDEVIINRMNQLKDEAAQGMKRMDDNRKQRSSYDAQYGGSSYFIDIRN